MASLIVFTIICKIFSLSLMVLTSPPSKENQVYLELGIILSGRCTLIYAAYITLLARNFCCCWHSKFVATFNVLSILCVKGQAHPLSHYICTLTIDMNRK